MVYITHPQLKFSAQNLSRIIRALFAKPQKQKMEQKLSSYSPDKNFVFTDLGRTAFRLILEKFNLKNCQIIMPAFICDIFWPILQEYNIDPIFCDIDPSTFNIKIGEVEQKITPQTKAILVCHTFGLALEIETISKIAKQHNLILIEDIAHGLGLKINGKYAGNFGDAAFSSLYKQFPCLRGGLAILPRTIQISEKELQKGQFSLRDFLTLLGYFSFFAWLFKKSREKLSVALPREKSFQKFVALNRISLNLFSAYLSDLTNNIAQKKKLASLLKKETAILDFQAQAEPNNIFAFFSILLPQTISDKRDNLFLKLSKSNIFCSRIWKDPIILNKEIQEKYNLDPRLFPNTLSISQRIINLPLQSHYAQKDLQKIIKALQAACVSKS